MGQARSCGARGWGGPPGWARITASPWQGYREASAQQRLCSTGLAELQGWGIPARPSSADGRDTTGSGQGAVTTHNSREAEQCRNAQTLVLCPHNDKEEGESKNSHRASGNMCCPMILPGNTWQNMGCCLQWFVSSGNNTSEGPKTLFCAPWSKAEDCSLMIHFSLWQSWLNSLSFFPFPLFHLFSWRVAFIISSATEQIINYFKLQNWNSSWHHYCCFYYYYAFFFSKRCPFPNLKKQTRTIYSLLQAKIYHLKSPEKWKRVDSNIWNLLSNAIP